MYLVALLLVVSMATGCFGSLGQTYSLKVNYDETQGNVNLPANADKLKKGTRITLEAEPKDGWYFLEWKGDDITEEMSMENPLMIVVNKNTELEVIFTDDLILRELTVTYDANQGTVTGLPKDLDEVPDRTLIQLKAIPKDGYEFLKWEGDVPEKQMNQDSINFRIAADTNITAIFQELPLAEAVAHRTSFEGNDLDGWYGRGTITVEQSDDYARTGDYSLKVTPGSGWNGGPGLTVTDMVELGETYIFSGWVYHTEGQLETFIMQMTYADKEGATIYDHLETNEEVPSDEWVKFNIEYTIPEEITSNDLVFYFEDTPGVDFLFYLDDVMISKVQD